MALMLVRALLRRLAAPTVLLGLSCCPAMAAETYQTNLGPMPLDKAVKKNLLGRGEATATLDGNILIVGGNFAGLPSPDADQYPADKDDPHHTFTQLAVSIDEVKRNFEKYNLLDDQVRFLEGWFKDTLPAAPIDRLAILRPDGDMYGSTMDTLRALYAKVSRGGYVIVDDYILPPCRQAVSDFRGACGIEDEIREVDGAAVFWQVSHP